MTEPDAKQTYKPPIPPEISKINTHYTNEYDILVDIYDRTEPNYPKSNIVDIQRFALNVDFKEDYKQLEEFEKDREYRFFIEDIINIKNKIENFSYEIKSRIIELLIKVLQNVFISIEPLDLTGLAPSNKELNTIIIKGKKDRDNYIKRITETIESIKKPHQKILINSKIVEINDLLISINQLLMSKGVHPDIYTPGQAIVDVDYNHSIQELSIKYQTARNSLNELESHLLHAQNKLLEFDALFLTLPINEDTATQIINDVNINFVKPILPLININNPLLNKRAEIASDKIKLIFHTLRISECTVKITNKFNRITEENLNTIKAEVNDIWLSMNITEQPSLVYNYNYYYNKLNLNIPENILLININKYKTISIAAAYLFNRMIPNNNVFFIYNEQLTLIYLEEMKIKFKIFSETNINNCNMFNITKKLAITEIVKQIVINNGHKLTQILNGEVISYQTFLTSLKSNPNTQEYNLDNINYDLLNTYIKLIDISIKATTAFIQLHTVDLAADKRTAINESIQSSNNIISEISAITTNAQLPTNNIIVQVLNNAGLVANNDKTYAKQIIINNPTWTNNLWRFINGKKYREDIHFHTDQLNNDLIRNFISSLQVNPDVSTLGRYGVVISSISVNPSAKIINEIYNPPTRSPQTSIAYNTRDTSIRPPLPLLQSQNPAGGLYINLRIVDIKPKQISATRLLLQNQMPGLLNPDANASLPTNIGVRTDTASLYPKTLVSNLHISIHDYSPSTSNQSHIKFTINGIEHNYILSFLLVEYIDRSIIKIKGQRTQPSVERLREVNELAELIAHDIIKVYKDNPLLDTQYTQPIDSHETKIKYAFEYFLNDFANYLSFILNQQIDAGAQPIDAQNTQMNSVYENKSRSDIAYQKYLKYKTKYLELLKKLKNPELVNSNK